MPKRAWNQTQVTELSATLPSFPWIVKLILESIDDPDGCLRDLVNYVNHDPLIAARVLSAANKASEMARRSRTVTDIHTALSLIGTSRLRKIALIGGVGSFVEKLSSDMSTRTLWRHSVAVGVACDELCVDFRGREHAEMALMSGLLHDVGQFWLYGIDADSYRECWQLAMGSNQPIEQVERQMFGVDHSVIGRWLSDYWELPAKIGNAIGAHHTPDNELSEPLVPLVHVAEVISNALGLMGDGKSRVHHLSAPACNALGIKWNMDSREVFGRIEARSLHANAFFG